MTRQEFKEHLYTVIRRLYGNGYRIRLTANGVDMIRTLISNEDEIHHFNIMETSIAGGAIVTGFRIQHIDPNNVVRLFETNREGILTSARGRNGR